MTKQVLCPECDGRGYISKCETWDYGNGLGGGQAWSQNCQNCHGTGIIQVPITNGDRIRAMSDEELAKWILGVMSHKVACFGEGAFSYAPCRNEEHDCVKCGIEWLKQPAEE